MWQVFGYKRLWTVEVRYYKDIQIRLQAQIPDDHTEADLETKSFVVKCFSYIDSSVHSVIIAKELESWLQGKECYQ